MESKRWKSKWCRGGGLEIDVLLFFLEENPTSGT
jgi:hypothetical protein